MKNILITTSSFDLNNFADYSYICSSGFNVIMNPYGKRLTETQVAEMLDDHVVGMIAGVEPLTRTVLQKAKSLKVISRCGIGLDNVDLNAARELGISVFNTPDAPTRSVAELTLAHILSLIRRIAESDRAIRKGNWKGLMGSLLSEQTVGVIGYGRIGCAVADLVSAFGARVLVHDMRKIEPNSAIKSVPIEELLSQSDIVTLHVPYAKDTHHLIDGKRLAGMKPTAFLVNVARGGLIDESALLEALQEKKLAGAALDCFEEEPYAGPLRDLENVQMTAHMGSYAREARALMEAESCEQLVKGLQQHGLLS